MEGLKNNPDCLSPDPRPIVTRKLTGRPPSKEDRPGGWSIQSGHQIEQRAFPTSTGPDKSTEVSLRHFDCNPIKPCDGLATPLIHFRYLVESHHRNLRLHTPTQK